MEETPKDVMMRNGLIRVLERRDREYQGLAVSNLYFYSQYGRKRLFVEYEDVPLYMVTIGGSRAIISPQSGLVRRMAADKVRSPKSGDPTHGHKLGTITVSCTDCTCDRRNVTFLVVQHSTPENTLHVFPL
jgi:hypothetical protein